MLPTTVRIFVATEPVDLRASFDRLSGVVRERFADDPRSGALFVFLNKSASRCKVLFHDRSGLCVLTKRLDEGTFRRATSESGAPRIEVDARTLAEFLVGVRPATATAAPKKVRMH